MLEDKRLIWKFNRGDLDALRGIYEKYKDDLVTLAAALLIDVSSAEDVVHDVFLAFAQAVEKFRLTGSPKGFLLTCVANRARNASTAKHRQAVGLDSAQAVDSSSDDPPCSIICNEQLGQLSRAMAQLPYEQREVLMLHFQAGMTFKTIAKSLGISVNTAKSRYRYGLDKLRLILDEVEE